MKQKQIIALVSATALVATALAGCGKTSEENTQKTAVGEQKEQPRKISHFQNMQSQ